MSRNIIILTLVALLLSATAIWYVGSLSNSSLLERTSIQAENMARHDRIKGFAADWSGNPAFPANYDALDPSISTALTANALFDPEDDYWGLPRSEGFELVDTYCTACHSIRIVMQQRADTPRWDELLTWMVEKQGMPELETQERALVLSYLSKEFNN